MPKDPSTIWRSSQREAGPVENGSEASQRTPSRSRRFSSSSPLRSSRRSLSRNTDCCLAHHFDGPFDQFAMGVAGLIQPPPSCQSKGETVHQRGQTNRDRHLPSDTLFGPAELEEGHLILESTRTRDSSSKTVVAWRLHATSPTSSIMRVASRTGMNLAGTSRMRSTNLSATSRGVVIWYSSAKESDLLRDIAMGV